MLRITVGRGNEDYTSIQEAVNAIPYEFSAEIEVHEGVYREKLFSDKKDLTIRGIGDVKIIWADGAREILDRGIKRGTFRSYTAFFSGEHLHLENLEIVNEAGEGDVVGQGIALYLDVSDSHLQNLRIIGHQDTLFLAPLPDEEREKGGFYGPRYLLPRKRCRSIIRDSYIEGTVDFIFGGGDALFENCEIKSIGKGYVTAPSGKKDWTGFVFVSCRFTSESSVDAESVYLMRPWRSTGKSLFHSCHIGKHIAGDGFSPWKGLEREEDECTFLLSDCHFEKKVEISEKHIMQAGEAELAVSSFDA